MSRGKRVRWDTKVISGRISAKMMEAIIEVVKTGHYVDVTDYLRDIIRKDLENRGAELGELEKGS